MLEPDTCGGLLIIHVNLLTADGAEEGGDEEWM